MEQLGQNIVIGLGTGLASGLVTGFYSGLLISRRNRFDSLQAELLRHANSIEYMQEPSHINVKRGTSIQMMYVAGELAHFGHRRAADVAFAGNKIFVSALLSAERGMIDVDTLESRLTEARNEFRSIRPSVKMYFPWGQV